MCGVAEPLASAREGGCLADFNLDGNVNVVEFLILLANWIPCL
jgi:hypothetical protein